MEKKSVYLQNLLFLLFDKYIDSPEIAGEKVASAIIGASKMLWPSRYEDTTVEVIRRGWIAEFIEGFKSKLNGRIT